ncbi:hypothetical protein NECAME_11005 [Necator americanus]|uniref:Uncharacterized protein n=1 Tax=Necator americanus TaxID=51031 RepID=W2T616_NECAM|nr:hypothetical protein NECAME_11005 [Necator americanus]ETN77460.1 hypothetical protein NECAME_11005 [Necator americanus]
MSIAVETYLCGDGGCVVDVVVIHVSLRRRLCILQPNDRWVELNREVHLLSVGNTFPASVITS